MNKRNTVLAGIVFILASSFVQAATEAIHLEMKVLVDGKQVLAPSLTLNPGEPVTYGELVGGREQYFITVVASRDEMSKAIKMKTQVGEVRDGKRVVLHSPELIAHDRSPASIEARGEKSQSPKFEISVVAQSEQKRTTAPLRTNVESGIGL